MPFSPENPHISAAFILSGVFSQFGDPLDFLARSFGINAKADRQQLAESLADRGGMGMPRAEARGSDKATHFRIEIVGKCEGKMVAQCKMSLRAPLMTLREMEECALAMTMGHSRVVMGVQITRGKRPETIAGLDREKSETFLRLYPQNVFNTAFFKDHVAVMKKDKKVKLLEVENAVMVELIKPWMYYDMPIPKRSGTMAENLLPFTKTNDGE
ncbi:MAG: hypothetical protein WCT04_02455 [Planctomycetota bacterium]